jgi:hypothetical protein
VSPCLKDLKISPEVKVYPKGATSMPTGSLEKVAKVRRCSLTLLNPRRTGLELSF